MLSDAWSFFFFFASLSFCELRDCLEAIPLGNAVFGVQHMFATGTTSSDENLWRELHTCDLKKFSDETRSEAVPAVLH